VRQASQAEAGVADANLAFLVAEDLRGDVYQGFLFGFDHCSSLVAPVHQH